jgi:GT2 family glycosyltransferase
MADELGSRETWVVDNGSSDGSADAVAREFPTAHLIRRERNEGVWARNYAIERTKRPYIVLLDDDSYPMEGTVARSVEFLEGHASIAAVVGRIALPDGGLEACALPSVLLSGAVCMRRRALDEVGGFAREFFRKAGEYDLSFRLLNAGWRIERFEDLVYRHDKFAAGRSRFTAHRMDQRNNLILVERYLPSEMRKIYRADWRQRYAAMARADGQRAAGHVARLEARCWRVRESLRGRSILKPETLETIFAWRSQQRAIDTWAKAHGVRRVIIADYSKNLYATYRACRSLGLEVRAIADNHPAFAGLRYRGIPIVDDETARRIDVDGVVLSNVNPARVEGRARELASNFGTGPLTLWSARYLRPGPIDQVERTCAQPAAPVVSAQDLSAGRAAASSSP